MNYFIFAVSLLVVALSAPMATAKEMSHRKASGRRVVDDCKEVPGDFKNAEPPYAKKPDGCSGINSPKEVRDKWGPVDFTPACNNHDRCYYTEGSKASTCNDQFFRDLVNACKNGTSKRYRIHGKTIRITNKPAELACEKVAVGYRAGVEMGVALGMFDKAQRLQRSYNHWYQRCHK